MKGAAAKPRRGRKPARESRSDEIRRRVVAWSLTPPAQREPQTLTELARELGISHQLASYYASPDSITRECSNRSQAIVDKASSEGRHVTQQEYQEILGRGRAAFSTLIPDALEVVRKFASTGNVRARKILRKHGL